MNLQTIDLFAFFTASASKFFPFFLLPPNIPEAPSAISPRLPFFLLPSPRSPAPRSHAPHSRPAPRLRPRSTLRSPFSPHAPFPIRQTPHPCLSPALFRHTPPFLSLFLSRLLFLSDFSPAPPPLRRPFFRFPHPVFSPFPYFSTSSPPSKISFFPHDCLTRALPEKAAERKIRLSSINFLT